jgi:hypothetical protein
MLAKITTPNPRRSPFSSAFDVALFLHALNATPTGGRRKAHLLGDFRRGKARIFLQQGEDLEVNGRQLSSFGHKYANIRIYRNIFSILVKFMHAKQKTTP